MYSTLFAKTQTMAEKQILEYLHWCEHVRRYTGQTIKTYRKDLAKFIADSSAKDLRKVGNDTLQAWQVRLSQEGKAGKTINSYRDAVVGCLKWLSKNGGHVAINFDLVMRAEEEHREAVYFTPEQIAAIKAGCGSARELLLVSLLYDTGLRISEVQALKVEHIDGVKIKVVQGKGRKDRLVFMLKSTKDLLDQWLHTLGITTGYIFPSPRKFGDPLTHQQIRDSINVAIRRAGFEEGSAHSIRHSNITALINGGMDVFTVQTLAGHSDPKVTRRYFHTNAEQLGQKFAQVFGAAEACA